MRKYLAGKDAGDVRQGQADTREWVFGLLGKPRYRQRLQQLEGLDLRRRSGCEPCLRALVMDEWTPDALHHMGWCESCRSAAIALGMHAPAARAAWYRRRAVWLAVAVAAAIAAPLVGSQVISNQGPQVASRGGSAHGVASSRTHGTTGTGTTGDGDTKVTPLPRSKRTRRVGHARGAGASRRARVHKALPMTT
jgi:hypothetical protein